MEIQNQSSLRWVRRECVGKGSYGTVCVGVRESDGVVFAVKSAAKDSLSSIEALENEIEILRSLSSTSPFIVEYYGDDETRSHRNLHVEYVAGGDVAKSGGVADVELIRSYTWCLVMALREIHSQGIVHCDVKGSNVLLCPTGGVAKLADFGSAKKVEEDDDERFKIVPRGSPLWMAPEVVRGESQGVESDIWSLGCTVIEMFTGVPAWQDKGAHTLYQIGYSDEQPEYPTRLSELGRDFLDKCLNRNPNLRWSCDQLLQHPFLVPASTTKIIESSPRSIFDWPNLDFSDDDQESEDEFDEISIRERISKLAMTVGVNWESDDGWVEVRGLSKEQDDDDKQEEVTIEGTSSEYFELIEGEEVISGESDYDCDDYDNDEQSSSSGGTGGDRCGHGEDHDGCCCSSCRYGVGEIVRREKVTAGLVDLLFLLFFMFSSTSLGLNYYINDDYKNLIILLLLLLLLDRIYFLGFFAILHR